jgi:hypothetical protein
MEDSATWLARNQQVLREGKAKVDLAIYSLKYWETIDYANRPKDYDDDGLLEQAGYSYDFVSPSCFALDNATVKAGMLDPEGPAYKAVIVDNETSMPTEIIERFVEYTERGLPIVFIGGLPVTTTYTAAGDFSAAIEKLGNAPRVSVVPDKESVPGALAKFEVRPAAAYGTPAPLLSNHRQSDEAHYYRFYNYGNADDWPTAERMRDVSTTVTLQGSGRPYLLDAWTGNIWPVAQYRQDSGSVTLDLCIGANDSVIVALAEEGWLGRPTGMVALPNSACRVEYAPNGTMIAMRETTGTVPVTLNDGQTVSVTFEEVPPPQKLTDWKLRVERWTKGAIPIESAKTTVDVGSVSGLRPWRKIPGLENTSGIGTYTITFMLKAGWLEGVGAVLDLGAVNDTFRLTVNGTPFIGNQNDPKIDIGQCLVRGKNTIEVEVASTLFNAWITEYGHDKQASDYGILGTVMLTPYRWVPLGTKGDRNMQGSGEEE